MAVLIASTAALVAFSQSAAANAVTTPASSLAPAARAAHQHRAQHTAEQRAPRARLPNGVTGFAPTKALTSGVFADQAQSSRTAIPGTSNSEVPTPPAGLCPPEYQVSDTAARFGICSFDEVPWTGQLDVDGEQDSILIDFSVKIWAVLAYNSRTWHLDADIDPVSVTYDVPPPTPMKLSAVNFCDANGQCDADPAKGVTLGTIEQGVALGGQLSVTSVGTATQTIGNGLELTVCSAGAEVCAPDVIPFDTTIQCDSLGTSQGQVSKSGCVVPSVIPVWTVSNLHYPTMGLVVKHMAMASGNLPGYAGLRGNPGKDSPLTYISRGSARGRANYSKACGHVSPPPDQIAAGNTSCDEYPFASTAQGAASGGPYSICWVPPKANNAQGVAFSAFLRYNRVLLNGSFKVNATYFGNNTGCTNTGGGAGSITPDNTLDSMFDSYGDNAGCADWSGGDATNSVALPGGERAWFFSDTYLNSAAARASLWYASSLHNSIVLQGAHGIIRTITGGNTCQETNLKLSFWDRYAKTPAVPPDAGSGGFYWTADQMVVGSDVVKFYYHGDPTAGSFTINYPAVATIPLSSLEHDSALTITPAEFSCGESDIIWGTALLNWDNDVYVYGWRSTGTFGDGIFLARTTADGLTDPGSWQLYDGMSGSSPVWGSCDSSPAALPISNGTTGFSVDSVNGSLWLVQFDYTDGQVNAAGYIGAHPSSTPWGFGNLTVPLYDPPTGYVAYPYYYQDYEARIQPGLGPSGDVVISYNVNTSAVDTGCVSANAHDVTIYRPRFIDVPVSNFNPKLAKPAPRPPANPAVELPARTAATSGIGGVTDWYYKGLGDSCPKIGAPTAPTLGAFLGLVWANWKNMGTDVWYYAYICDKTEHSCATEGTSGDWLPAWPTSDGPLWSTMPQGVMDPIEVTSTEGHSTNGHTFAIYIRSFGAGNGSGGGNSPPATVKVSST